VTGAGAPEQPGRTGERHNERHQLQVHWVQIYPPDQFKALFAPLSRPGCTDKSP
jgi:hypothetical protein